MNLRTVKLADLHLDPSNARLHDEKNLDAIEASLKQFGQVEPLVVQKSTGKVIGGNGRLAVMRRQGAIECQVVEVDIDDSQATALGIALNRTSELGAWDDGTLARLLQELPADLQSIAGFDAGDLTDLLTRLAAGVTVDQVEIPPPPDTPATRRGDVWILGDHRLMNGDSSSPTDLDILLGGQQIHLVNTDPPYNVKIEPRSDRALAAGNKGMPGGGQYDKIRSGTLSAKKLRAKDRHLANDFVDDGDFHETMRGVFSNAARALVPGRAFYVWCGAFPSNNGGPANTETFPQLFREFDLRYAQMIIWNKGHGILGRKDFMTQYEVCLYGWKGGAAHEWFGPNNITDLWDVQKVPGQNMVHLTEKPVELAARAIQYSTQHGENVLDLFGGSGSTLMGAEQTGRRAFLMELDPLYCDVILQRWEKVTGKQATLDGDGRTYAEVAAERLANPTPAPDPAAQPGPTSTAEAKRKTPRKAGSGAKEAAGV